MKHLAILLGYLVLLGPLRAAAESTPAPAPAPTPPPPPATQPPSAPAAETDTPAVESSAPPPTIAEEIASLLRIGDQKKREQDWASAILAYNQVLAAGRSASPEQVRDALLGLARSHRGDLRFTKAVAIYERFIKEYPGDAQLPLVFLELGRSLRALGAHRLAITRFYSVINTTLKLPEEGADTYRQLARTAQFEIAETYFQTGDFDQAFRFFSRLTLLDLAPADRARAAFKSAYALNLKGEDDKAVTHLRAYLSLYPDGEDAPEARYLLAVVLRRLGRTQQALVATIELLKIEKSRTAADPKSWSHWQRKTGNQLANSFFEQGDIMSALTIYEYMRDLGGSSEWLLPVKYQIGLCQERLRQPALARATYDSILAAINTEAASERGLPPVLNDIKTMVAWRLNHLAWLESTAKKSPMLGLVDPPATTLTPPPATTTP